MNRKDVIEIVDRLKREVPPEVPAELAGDTEPRGAAAFVDLYEKIDEMDLNQGSEDLPAGAAAHIEVDVGPGHVMYGMLSHGVLSSPSASSPCPSVSSPPPATST